MKANKTLRDSYVDMYSEVASLIRDSQTYKDLLYYAGMRDTGECGPAWDLVYGKCQELRKALDTTLLHMGWSRLSEKWIHLPVYSVCTIDKKGDAVAAYTSASWATIYNYAADLIADGAHIRIIVGAVCIFEWAPDVSDNMEDD